MVLLRMAPAIQGLGERVLLGSHYNADSVRIHLQSLTPNPKMHTMKIVCAVCGEETGGNPTYSLYGSVHKWGPTDHTFEPKIVEEEQ
jgi:hypothetical protein